jgi:hypothetical protein
LTNVAKLPPGAERSLDDPYAPKKSPWPKILLVLLILAAIGVGLYYAGYLEPWYHAAVDWVKARLNK